MTIIISGFPGVGKTYFAEKYKDKTSVIDSDSSNFSWLDKDNGIRNPDFPNNYIKYIEEELIGEYDVVFVSTHKSVRDALNEKGVEYYLVYPDRSLKEYYVDWFGHRGSSQSFINMIESNWDDFLAELEADTLPLKVVLNKEESVETMLTRVLNRPVSG